MLRAGSTASAAEDGNVVNLDDDEQDSNFDNNEEENEKEEFQGLLGVNKNKDNSERVAVPVASRNNTTITAITRSCRLRRLCLPILFLIVVLGLSIHYGNNNNNTDDDNVDGHNYNYQPHTDNNNNEHMKNLNVPYSCPSKIQMAKNDKNGNFEYYNNDTEHHHHDVDNANNNTTTTTTDNKNQTQEFMNMFYGAWDITPRQRKALNTRWIHWYANAFANKKKKKKTMYESACGVGLTMYVILELLQEEYNITGIEVYGNEYIPEDVETANFFYNQQENDKNSPLHIHRGQICHGDSTNLFFVPENAFDVVFTGYIDPIVDGLNLGISRHRYRRYCKSDDPKKHAIVQRDQAVVEDWFATWTHEMIRIAKPGGTIVVESIDFPQCQTGGWGGVTREWWVEAVTKYGWDVDLEQIEFTEFDPGHHYKHIHDRYNVKLVKLEQ